MKILINKVIDDFGMSKICAQNKTNLSDFNISLTGDYERARIIELRNDNFSSGVWVIRAEVVCCDDDGIPL